MANEKEREKERAKDSVRETTPNESSMQSNGAEGVPSTQRDENVSVLENFHSTIYFLVTRLRVVYTTIPTFSSMDATTRAVD